MEKQSDIADPRASYSGQFIAVRDGNVVAHAGTHGDLVRRLADLKIDPHQVVFEYVRPIDRICAY